MNQELLDKVLKSPRLPSLPTIAIEVINLVQKKDVNIKQIAHTIQHDPALTSKILKTVNSSFYGQSSSIGTISHALVVMGLNSVKTLALGFSLVGNLANSGDDGFNHFNYWKRSLYGAVAARSLATQIGLVQQEESFLAGLMQDLGLLAMHATLGEEYQDLLNSIGSEHRELLALEREYLDIDHAQVGGVLAETWHLPPLLVNAIRCHETPDDVSDDTLPMVRCVALGGYVADVYMSEKSGEALDQYYAFAKDWFHLSKEDAEPLLTAIHANTAEMKHLFDLPTGDLGNVDHIMAKANDALTNLSMMQHQHAAKLEEQNRELTTQATIDSLTGVANRRSFNEFLARQFEQVTLTNEPLSILFMDVDHFKNFNDTYGHPTGDRVLVNVAKVLQDAVDEKSLAARYGGEEFSMILVNTNRLQATRKAEQVRQTIEAMIVPSDENEPLSVTASIGVATHDGTFFQSANQLLKAADQGVYAAKNSGRNAVRVFAPRTKNIPSI